MNAALPLLPALAFALPAVVWLAAALALAEAARRARLWRAGGRASVDWIGGLKALPRRYLVDVHHVVGRDPKAARMHVAAAGGLAGASALAALGVLPPLAASPVFWGAVALLFAIALAGAAMVGARRYPVRPRRLSGGRFQVLPFLLAAYAAGGAVASVSLAILLSAGAEGAPSAAAAIGPAGGGLVVFLLVGLVAAAVGGLGLARFAGSGPMRHAFAGALHLVAHPRPGRFEGVRETALRPLDLDAARLGVAAPADFAWNRLAGFDACIQCGRCEAACPAFAAGQPLNPKRLMQDLSAAMVPGGTNAGYAGSPYPNARPVAGLGGPLSDLVGAGAMIHPDTLWSCTTCRACVEECPMMIEHVDAVIDLRRHEVLERGAALPKAAEALEALRLADDPGARPAAARTDFAAGLTLPAIAAREGRETDVLLWLGEGAYDLRYGRTLRALVRLMNAADIDFAVLGAEERDCGDLARRLGDEATFQRLARANIETLSRHRFRRIVTSDPHAFHVIANEYPAFGGRFAVLHHTSFLDGLVAEGRLAMAAIEAAPVAYHDPCYLARYNGETDAPRRLIDAAGLTRVEMERSGKRAMCCGGGGGAPVSDVAGDRRIPDLRMEQAQATGAAIVAVACPGCTTMLEGVVGARPEVRDVAELVLRAVEAAARPAGKAAAEAA